MIKYFDILYYKNLLRENNEVTSFVYIKISEELYDIILNELSVDTKYCSQPIDIFNYQFQFKYDGMYFLRDVSLNDNKSTFYVIINGGKKYKPQHAKFATFDIDILSENERIIKKLLE